LVQGKWDFDVRKMENFEYIASFLDKSSLDTFVKLRSLEMPIYRYRVKISKTNVDPKYSSMLQSVWVKIFNLPGSAREEGIIKEVASLIVKPLVVDELSLIKDVLLRVKVDCHDSSRVRGFVEVFFNKIAYELKYMGEGLQDRATRIGGDGGSSKSEDKDQDRDRKTLTENMGRAKGNLKGKVKNLKRLKSQVMENHRKIQKKLANMRV
jgi:hypothetical protein